MGFFFMGSVNLPFMLLENVKKAWYVFLTASYVFYLFKAQSLVVLLSLSRPRCSLS
jgi:hypothetical protein